MFVLTGHKSHPNTIFTENEGETTATLDTKMRASWRSVLPQPEGASGLLSCFQRALDSVGRWETKRFAEFFGPVESGCGACAARESSLTESGLKHSLEQMRNNPSIRASKKLAETRPFQAGSSREAGAGGCIGICDIERCLGRSGLVRGRLHAIHPAAAGDEPAATGFALALLKSACNGAGPILWVQGRWPAVEAGRPYGIGLAQLGLDSAGMIVV